MNTISTWLWFDTEGEGAARFYTSVFEDSSIGEITRYGAMGPGPEGSVMTVAFQLNGHPFFALNGGPAYAHQFTEAISFQVSCKSQAEVDHYWDTLVEGGEESMCGWLKDKFGVSWQIVPTRLDELIRDPDQAKSARVMQAMLSMKKIQIDELERAALAE